VSIALRASAVQLTVINYPVRFAARKRTYRKAFKMKRKAKYRRVRLTYQRSSDGSLASYHSKFPVYGFEALKRECEKCGIRVTPWKRQQADVAVTK
jgi:hypothetical protein